MNTELKESIEQDQRQKAQRIAGDPPTTTATVGRGHNEENDVPAHLGIYFLWDCPNDNTINYTRRWHPTDDDRPAIAASFTVTCEGSDDWQVSRKVVIEDEYEGCGYPVHDLTHIRTVGRGFDALDDAIAHARRLAEAESLTDRLPPELDKSTVEQYRELERE